MHFTNFPTKAFFSSLNPLSIFVRATYLLKNSIFESQFSSPSSLLCFFFVAQTSDKLKFSLYSSIGSQAPLSSVVFFGFSVLHLSVPLKDNEILIPGNVLFSWKKKCFIHFPCTMMPRGQKIKNVVVVLAETEKKKLSQFAQESLTWVEY